LKVKDFFNVDRTLKSPNEISALVNTVMSPESMAKLKNSLTESLYLAGKCAVNIGGTGLSLETFITRFKKGSRQFRRILGCGLDSKIRCKNRGNIKTFFRLINLDVIDEEELLKFNRHWVISVLPNKTREFAYKFASNILGLNVRVSHFNRNISRECTFCRLKNVNNAPDECFLHLFFECNSVNPILTKFAADYLPELTLNDDVKLKKFFFLGTNPRSDKIDNMFFVILKITVMFYFWECKLQKKQPSYSGLLNEVFFSIEKIRLFSGKLREAMNIDLNLFRVWQAEVSNRR
jgi:hypothetical protein